MKHNYSTFNTSSTMFRQILTFALILLLCLPMLAVDYHFLGKADDVFFNPANWHPNHPGLRIEAGDRLFIQEDARMPGAELQVEGYVEIANGVTFEAGSLRIGESAKVMNFGMLQVEGVYNSGLFLNEPGATASLSFMANYSESVASNLPGATLELSGDLATSGKFYNYGLCNIGHDLICLDNSHVEQLSGGSLNIAGTLRRALGAGVFIAAHSQWNAPEHTALAENHR